MSCCKPAVLLVAIHVLSLSGVCHGDAQSKIYESIQPASERQAQLLGEKREWQLNSGETYTGTLKKWAEHPGLVLFADQFGRGAILPERQFAPSSQKEIAIALASHRALIFRLAELPVQENITASLVFTGERPPSGVFPVTVEEESIYWKGFSAGQKRYLRSSTDVLESDSLKRLEDSIAASRAEHVWQCAFPRCRFKASLTGRSFGKFIFRGPTISGNHFRELEFAVWPEDLSGSSIDHAEKLLKEMDKGGERVASETPKPILVPLDGGGAKLVEVNELTEDNVSLTQYASDRNAENGYRITVSERTRQNIDDASALMRYRMESAWREIAAEPSTTRNSLDAALRSLHDEITDQAPLDHLSRVRLWFVRDTAINRGFLGQLFAEQGAYYVFLQPTDTQGENSDVPPKTFAVLKQELTQDQTATAEHILANIGAYKARRPQFELPPTDTSFRLIRMINAVTNPSLSVAEPIAIVETSRQPSLSMRLLGAAEGKIVTVFQEKLHAADRAELKLTLTAGKSRMLGSEEHTKAMATVALGDFLAKEHIWVPRSLTHPADSAARSADQPTKSGLFQIGMRAAYEGVHQDSLVLKDNQGNRFLIERGVLSPKSLSLADRLEEQLRAFHKAGAAANPSTTIPTLRVLGTWKGSPMIGRSVRVQSSGAVSYYSPDGQRQRISERDVTDSLRAEIETQLAADAKYRSRDLTAQELTELRAFTREYRKQAIARAQEMAQETWWQEGAAIGITGSFEMFDGQDAILRNPKGKFFRVYTFAIRSDSLEKMKQLSAQRAAQARRSLTEDLDPASVTLRQYRGRVMGALLPGTPLAYDNGILYFRGESGGSFQHPVDRLHPRDMSEMRGEVHRTANNIELDTTVDARLRAPIEELEYLRGDADLEPHWEKRLSHLAKPAPRTWEQHSIDLPADESIVAISYDGSTIAKAGRSLQIVEPKTGKNWQVDLAGSPQHVSVSGNAKHAHGVIDDVLWQWQYESGESFPFTEPLGSAVATCQSKDGQKIFFLLSDSTLVIVDAESRTTSRMPVGMGPLLPNAWCSPAGDRLAVVSDAAIFLYRWNESRGKFVAEPKLTVPYTPALLSFGEELLLVASPDAVTASIVFEDGGRRGVRQYVTGIRPAWIGIERIGNQDRIHVVGRREDPISAKANYYFSAVYGFNRKLDFLPQSLDAAPSTEMMFCQSGAAALSKSESGWALLSRAPVVSSQLAPLDGIARELVAENRVDQIDAAWRYLRGDRFSEIGEYPDQAAELFLDYVLLHVANFEWQHGGDLQARAELLLKRWGQLAPQSQMVTVLSAMRLRNLAWAARGSGFANRVSRAQFYEFEKYMQQVRTLVRPLLNDSVPPTRAFNLGFDVTMSLSLGVDITESLAERMLRTPVRLSTTAHAAVALSLLPRWHGQPGDSEAYIEKICDQLGGPTGDRMYAQLILGLVAYYPGEEPVSQVLELDPARLARGLEAYYEVQHSDRLAARALRVYARENDWDNYRRCLTVFNDKRIFLSESTVEIYKEKMETLSLAFPDGPETAAETQK